MTTTGTTRWFRKVHDGQRQIWRWPRIAAVLPAALLVLAVSQPAQGVTACPDKFPEHTTGFNLSMLVESNFPIDVPNPAIKRVVIVHHGSSRNCGDYFDRVLNSATAVGKQNETLVIAPQTITHEDIEDNGFANDILYWGHTETPDNNWRGGDISDVSPSSRPAQISNYAVYDDLFEDLTDGRFVNLDTIVFTGFSAGGQVLDRYAPGSTVDLGLPGNIRYIYVPASPSSYVYMDGERVIAGTTDQFEVPAPGNQCSGDPYNDYKYGLDSRNIYMSQLSVNTIRNNFKDDIVVWMIGGNDTGTSGLDATCPANLQGSNRLTRSEIYFNYLQHFYGPTILNTHEYIVVPGVGHDSNVLYNTDIARRVLFDCNNNGVCEPPDVVIGETNASCPNDCTGGGCNNDPDCDDGLFCNGAETCVSGSCQAGTAPNCNDGVGCTDDSCNEATDSCDNIANDANCDDGLFCNGAETCSATLDCQAGSDPCGGSPCDEVNDVCQCSVPADCDDADLCTVDDCVAGSCTNTPVNCDDSDVCTTDSCDPGTGSCVNDPINCDDADPCTADSCNPATGCVNDPISPCCGDSTCESGEDCNTCPADCFSSGAGATCGNGLCEAGDGEDCISCPADCRGKQNGKLSNQYCCGAGGGTNPVPCSDSRCTASGFDCTDVPATASCCGDFTCEGSEDPCNCSVDCGTPPANETNCTDGIDEDCDGPADCADSDCFGDPACSCLPPGDPCTEDGECCSNKCKGNGTCR